MTKEELLMKENEELKAELKEERRKNEALNALFELKTTREEIMNDALSAVTDISNRLEEKYEETIETLLKIALDD
jgi:hypothetical protein